MTQDKINKDMLNLKATDEDNAIGFMVWHGQSEWLTSEDYSGWIYHEPSMVIWTPETGWLYWVGTHWSMRRAEQKLNQLITESLRERRKLYVDADREGMVSKTKPDVRNRNNTKIMLLDMVSKDYSDFNQSPDLLNCKNGVVDLRTGNITPHSPDQLFTYCIDIEYKPEATSPLWLSFLDGSVGGGQDVTDFLQRAVGYSLTGHTNEEVLIYIHGATRTGKGTFTNTLLKVLGKPLSAGIGFETFQNKRDGDSQNFDLAELVPTRFIVASESNRYKKLNAAMLKRLTGGDDIFCAKKGKQPFTFTPQFIIWLISNFPANLDVDDAAAWYRVLTVVFPNSQKGKEDKTLKARLQRKANLEAILAWAIVGSGDWYKEGLNAPDAVRKQTEADRAERDYVLRFINEYYNLIPDDKVKEQKAWIPSSAIYHVYKQWTEDEGYPLKGQGQFVVSLKDKGFVTVRKRLQGKMKRCIWGLELIKSVTL